MAGWHVWGELRRRSHITLVWAYLSGADGRIEQLPDGSRQITLDARLGRRARRATLAHELVHDERGILYTNEHPAALVAKEEALVEAETTRRLVPLDELDDLVRTAVLNDGTVTWREVADHFDVPEPTAQQALEQLQRRARDGHPTSRARRTVERRRVA